MGDIMYLVKKTLYSNSPAHIIDGDDTVCKVLGRVNLDNWEYVDAPGNTPVCKKCDPDYYESTTTTEKKHLPTCRPPTDGIKFQEQTSDYEGGFNVWDEWLDAVRTRTSHARYLLNRVSIESVDYGCSPIEVIIDVPNKIGKLISRELLIELSDEIQRQSGKSVLFYLSKSSVVASKKLYPHSSTDATDKTYAEKSEEFLQSREWRELRYKVLQKYGAKCMCCGAVKGGDVYICVDHIKPRYKYPELKLEFDNLQVLCNECNHGKGAHDETDYRHTQQNENATVTVDDDGTININITIKITT